MATRIDIMDTTPITWGNLTIKFQQSNKTGFYRAQVVEDGQVVHSTEPSPSPFHCRISAIDWLKKRNFHAALGLRPNATKDEVEEALYGAIAKEVWGDPSVKKGFA